MNKLTKKPSTEAVFKSIWYDYLYPNPIRNDEWILSQDIQDQQLLIECLELAEQFVERVAKSTECPFIFDKTLNGTFLKKVNISGKLFYNLLRYQNESALNPGGLNSQIRPSATFKIQNFDRVKFHYEVSEYSKIIYTVATELNLNSVPFSYDPMSKLGIEGLLEGEFINSFVTRLRDAMSRKRFKERATERKNEATQSFTKSKRYIDRLYANCPYLYGIRMSIYYRNERDSQISLAESNNHLMKFLEPFEEVSVKGIPVGFWWKREYMTELGYWYQTLFLFDGQNNPYDPQWIDLCGNHWASVTCGEGKYAIPFVPEWDHQPSGTGFSQQHQYGFESHLSSIQLMLMRDVYLRLERSHKYDHFGMGKLPKLSAPTPVSNKFMHPMPKRF